MRERLQVTRILTEHFFRRFFDNDTVQVDGDTLTTVIRAVSAVAVPGLMYAFFLQNQYPRRGQWGAIEDQYLFVLLSFVVMGAVTIFEWGMLFPDRIDFLILSPLPLKPMQMLAAKATALCGFVALFLVGSNFFAAVLYPAICKGDLPRQLYAHTVAVVLAGLFSAFSFLALSGILLCVLSTAVFRIVSPLLQMVCVAMLVLLMLWWGQYGNLLEAALSGTSGAARWGAPFWFLAVYDQLYYGDAAPKFAHELARYAVRGTMYTALAALITYPIAWSRMRRRVLEGASQAQRQPSRLLAWIVHSIIREPAERAVIHFIGQTIRRNNRYQVYLAMYGGTGLALAMASAVKLHMSPTSVWMTLSGRGLHALMPLLLFWVVAGLRTAFAFPLNLSAGWIFRITGADVSSCAIAGRKWVLFCAAGVTCLVLIALSLAGWNARQLLVQAVCGACLCVLLTDGFFFHRSVPFNQPRMPGRTNFPLMLTLYVGVFPPFVFGFVDLEAQMEKNVARLLLLCFGTLAIHAGLGFLQGGPMEIEEEMEGYEGEFQLLGLS